MDTGPGEERPGFGAWLRTTNHNPKIISLIRRARRALPGDPEFGDPLSTTGEGGVQAAVRATIAARDAVKTVEVDGYTPRMRAGVHTGRPQRIGSDWLGVDVNIAARVMERATRGGLIVSQATLARIPAGDLEDLDVTVKRVRRAVFGPKQSGVPADLVMYRLKSHRDSPGEDDGDDGHDGSGE